MRDEIMQEQLGSSFLVQQLANCMLVEVLRALLADAEPDIVEWLSAITDPKLKAAILSAHDDSSRSW